MIREHPIQGESNIGLPEDLRLTMNRDGIVDFIALRRRVIEYCRNKRLSDPFIQMKSIQPRCAQSEKEPRKESLRDDMPKAKLNLRGVRKDEKTRKRQG